MTNDSIAKFIELFCSVDDFCLEFEAAYNKRLLGYGIRKRIRRSTLHLSEVMTRVCQ